MSLPIFKVFFANITASFFLNTSTSTIFSFIIGLGGFYGSVDIYMSVFSTSFGFL